MDANWKEVVRLKFRGQRFQDHAFDLSALSELVQFQKMVAETAKVLWHAANPDRERLPKHFEDRTRLCLRRIEEGSAVAPLEVYDAQMEFFSTEAPIQEAVALAYDVFSAVEQNNPLPDRFPRALLDDYSRWGLGLGEDETIEIQVPDSRKPACVSQSVRQRLAAVTEGPHEAEMEFEGRVLEADVHRHQFQLWTDENKHVTMRFNSDQEDLVTSALKEHRVRRMRLRGMAELSPDGQPLRITSVKSIEVLAIEEEVFDESAPSIEDQLAALASDVPMQEWERLPTDLSSDLDHYIYGTPKR